MILCDIHRTENMLQRNESSINIFRRLDLIRRMIEVKIIITIKAQTLYIRET